MRHGACLGAGPRWFFPDQPHFHVAKKICVECEVVSECLEYALAVPEHHGVWGGMTPLERAVEAHDRQQAAG